MYILLNEKNLIVKSSEKEFYITQTNICVYTEENCFCIGDLDKSNSSQVLVEKLPEDYRDNFYFYENETFVKNKDYQVYMSEEEFEKQVIILENKQNKEVEK